MKRALDGLPLLVLLAFTAAMAWNPLDIQTHNAYLNTPYGGTFSGNFARLVIGLYLVFRGPGTMLRLASPPGIMVIVPLGLLSSGLWSVDPARTLATTLDLVLVALSAATLADRLGPEILCRWLVIFGAGIILASCLVAQAGDPHALMGAVHAGLWRGLFTHKNAFGAFAAIILILAVTLPRLRPWMRGAVAGLCVFALWQSGSVAAQAAAGAGLATLLAAWVAARLGAMRGVWLVLLLTGFAAGLIALPAFWESILQFVGRDAALSGRLGLWRAASAIVQSHPFGAGYGTGGGPLALQAMQESTGWAGARQAHNAYLATALDLGWLGLIAYLAGIGLAMRALLSRRTQRLAGALLGMLALHVTLGMAEAAAGPYPTVTVFVLCCLFAASAASVPAMKRSAMAVTV